MVERTFSATRRSGGLVPFSWVGESLYRAIAMAKRLYVGNLKYTVSSEQLQDLFEQYGAVSSATVLSDRETGRSRGFGFVEMSNDDEADAAIESLDGQDFDGRRLTVNEATPTHSGRWRWRWWLSRWGRLPRWRRLWRPVLTNGQSQSMSSIDSEDELSRAHRELLLKIERVLDESVTADLRADGGDVVVVGLDPDNILQVRLTGACQGCSSSVFTLSMRIEAALEAEFQKFAFSRPCLDSSCRRQAPSCPPGNGRGPLMSMSPSAHTNAATATLQFGWRRSSGRSLPRCPRTRNRVVSGEPQEVDTIFVGGGTPTRLDPFQLSRLCAIIRRWLKKSPGGEWTIEANPGTLDLEKVVVLLEAGVDRISLGAQSFKPDLLRVLERHHGRAEVEQAVAIVSPRFSRWSLDLIFGVPGSTLEDWLSDLESALALGPSHLSCYGLVFEKGTALWTQQGWVR